MRKEIYIADRAYTKELILIDLEALQWLQNQAIKSDTTPSQLINNILLKELANENGQN